MNAKQKMPMMAFALIACIAFVAVILVSFVQTDPVNVGNNKKGMIIMSTTTFISIIVMIMVIAINIMTAGGAKK